MRFSFTVLITCLLALSCSDDDTLVEDITRPEIDLRQPSNFTRVEAGRSIGAEATFTDDQKLAFVDVEISKRFDLELEQKVGSQSFLLKTRQALSGESDKLNLLFPIPVDAQAGLYSLQLTAADAAGNFTLNRPVDDDNRDFILTHQDAPVLNGQPSSLQLAYEETYLPSGTFTDPTGEGAITEVAVSLRSYAPVDLFPESSARVLHDPGEDRYLVAEHHQTFEPGRSEVDMASLSNASLSIPAGTEGPFYYVYQAIGKDGHQAYYVVPIEE